MTCPAVTAALARMVTAFAYEVGPIVTDVAVPEVVTFRYNW